MSTILDVAKLAGVSKSTVSRVLNQPEAVKPEVRLAVTEAMEKLDYTPSYFAQGIRTGKTKTIAMLVPDYSNVFYSELFRGVEDVALKAGYMVLICNTDRGAGTEHKYIQKLIGRKIDGIIYNTYTINRDNINYMVKLSQKLPVVFMDNVFEEDDPVSYVVTEGCESTRAAVNYLYRQGRRRIACMKIDPKISVVENRYQGYLKGLADCSLPLENELIYRPNTPSSAETSHLELGAEAADYFAGLPQPPDAIVSCFDILAMGCMRRLKHHGIQIPRDIAVMGFDNISHCELVEPALSTIAQPIRQMGAAAAQIVMDQINGDSTAKRIVYPGELVIRQST